LALIITAALVKLHYRNPIVAETMKALGYVNKFGYGIQCAEAALKANGSAPIEFEIDDRVFLATIRRKQPREP
jgi:ATP-dependent DNA helicase RecG